MSASVQCVNPASEAAPCQKTSSSPRWWVVVLAVLAIPVGLPILVSLAAAVFSIIVAIVSIVFSFAVAGLSLIVAGIASIFFVPFVVFAELGSAVLIGGMGLVSIGLGIVFLLASIKLTKALIGLAKFVSRKLFRRNEHGQQQ